MSHPIRVESAKVAGLFAAFWSAHAMAHTMDFNVDPERNQIRVEHAAWWAEIAKASREVEKRRDEYEQR